MESDDSIARTLDRRMSYASSADPGLDLLVRTRNVAEAGCADGFAVAPER